MRYAAGRTLHTATREADSFGMAKLAGILAYKVGNLSETPFDLDN